ncbi:MAG TPA: helix-turn-helix transcriptional regulator [Candidatus Dormibacteraeota bacterium]
MSPDIPIGERVRFFREAQHKKQTVVAGLAGITVDYLSQIERGLKTPTIPVLHAIARILSVPTSELLGEPPSESEGHGHSSTTAIHGALLGYQLREEGAELPSLGELRRRVDAAWKVWQSSPTRYTEAGELLPALVLDTEQAIRAHNGTGQAEDRREAFRVAADLYFLLRTFCKRIGRIDLSLLAADRAMRAAESADDPLRIAAAKWNLGHVLLAEGEAQAAEEVAVKAADALEPHLDDSDTRFVAMYGALHLVAVAATVRRGDAWSARARLREKAEPAAERVGEGNVFWTVFGPTNVRLHAVSLEMEAGEATEALRLADGVDSSRSPSIERRLTFQLEVARCYEQRRDDPAVLLHLLGAEHEASEDLRYNVLARDLVRGLVKRARPSYAAEARGLAVRIGLLSA